MSQTPKSNSIYIMCMVAIVVISLCYKAMFITYPFHGLEYEDAFVFSDVARNLLYNYDWHTEPFQTKTCIEGSLSNCYQFGTYGGHYMVFPLIISLFNKFFNYSVNNTFIVNYIASALVLLYFIKTLTLLKVGRISICISTILLVTTPFLNIFNTSGLSETLSSLFVIMTIYLFFKSGLDGHNYKTISFWLFILSTTISVLTKRENLILLSLPVLGILFPKEKENTFKINRITNLIILFVVPTGIAFLYNIIAKIDAMEAAEKVDIGVSTFNLDNLTLLFPKYLTSFISVKYFGITGVVLLITITYVIIFCKRYEFKIVAMLSTLFLFMYSSHYRSYYQVHYGTINIFETLRYIVDPGSRTKV